MEGSIHDKKSSGQLVHRWRFTSHLLYCRAGFGSLQRFSTSRLPSPPAQGALGHSIRFAGRGIANRTLLFSDLFMALGQGGGLPIRSPRHRKDFGRGHVLCDFSCRYHIWLLGEGERLVVTGFGLSRFFPAWPAGVNFWDSETLHPKARGWGLG